MLHLCTLRKGDNRDSDRALSLEEGFSRGERLKDTCCCEAAMSDGREEREEQEWRREQEKRKDREDRLEREADDQWKPERQES